MKNKLKKSQTRNTEQTLEQNLTIVLRKSQLAAADEFDYQKLIRNSQGFLNATLEQTREELKFTYDIHDVREWSAIQKESREMQFAALLDAEKLGKAAEKYSFSMNPENLYYDIQGRIYVRDRDIYGPEAGEKEEQFLNQYKALIGATLQKKYKFEDYFNGGMDLLLEDRFLGEIAACEDILQISESLRKEYERYRKLHGMSYVEVRKKHYRGQKRALILFVLLSVASISLNGYLGGWERPFDRAVIAANQAYLQSDYVATVEALEYVEIGRMNVYQKYILAVSCVKCESFNNENQKNILNTISLNGDEKVMEYWIHINRLDTTAAADIAMQLSSDQLLYYAYLKEKTVVENDGTLTGEEKKARLSDIESKLDPLKDEYSSLTEE